MSSEELRKALSDATAEQDELLADATAKAEAIVGRLSEVMPALWDTEIARVRDRNPDKALELGPEGISEVKAKLNELSKQAGKVVRENMGSDKKGWPHLLPPQERSGFKRLYRQQDLWPDDAWRQVLGAIGGIYQEFDLLEDRDLDSWRRGQFRRYPFGTGPPPEVESLVTSYGESVVALAKVDERIFQLADALKRAEAKELWDKTEA